MHGHTDTKRYCLFFFQLLFIVPVNARLDSLTVILKNQKFFKEGEVKELKIKTPETTCGDVQREERAIIKLLIDEFEEQDLSCLDRCSCISDYIL
jgi:hypothetical protein